VNREALDSLDKEALIRLVLTQADTIAALNRQVGMLTARLPRLEADNGALRAENAALREKLKLQERRRTIPARRPRKAGSRRPTRRRRAGARADAHRIPERTVPCIPIRRASATSWPIIADMRDRPVERRADPVPRLRPHRASPDQAGRHAGDAASRALPLCGQPFRAEAPADMPPGSPFGLNLRALVIYLRFVHAISFERLARLMSDLFGLAISEGALVAMLARQPAGLRPANRQRAAVG
jgi:transposase